MHDHQKQSMFQFATCFCPYWGSLTEIVTTNRILIETKPFVHGYNNKKTDEIKSLTI